MTWEPSTNLENAREAVQDFHTKFPNKPQLPALQKLEIPMTLFPKELFRPIPEPLTEFTPANTPSENMLAKFARNRVCALRRE